MDARRHGQEGALAPPSENVVKCFVHSKTLTTRIIYALFSQLAVVGFWRLRPQTPTGALSLDRPLEDFRPQTGNSSSLFTKMVGTFKTRKKHCNNKNNLNYNQWRTICPPLKNHAGAHETSTSEPRHTVEYHCHYRLVG